VRKESAQSCIDHCEHLHSMLFYMFEESESLLRTLINATAGRIIDRSN